MVENRRYFHVSEIPDLLAAKDLYYKDNKTGKNQERSLSTIRPDYLTV